MSSFWTGSIWHEDATGLDSLLPQTSHNLCLVLSRRCYSASKWSTVRPGKLSFSLQWDATCDATKAWFEHVTRSSRSRAVALFNAFEAKPIWIPQTRDNVKKSNKTMYRITFLLHSLFCGHCRVCFHFFHFFRINAQPAASEVRLAVASAAWHRSSECHVTWKAQGFVADVLVEETRPGGNTFADTL